MGFADWVANGNRLLWLAVAIPLSCVLAALAYWGIERPILFLRHKAGSNAPMTLRG
jgi:peptidoglycan/LPS O-acetylase OafA/YrhL